MLITVKGFGVLTAYDNKVLGTPATVGELSPIVKTYTSKGETFVDPVITGGRFFCMHSKDESGSDYSLSQAMLDQILTVIQAVSTFNDTEDAQTQFNATFPSDFAEVTVGPSILGDNQFIPSYVEFSFEDAGNTIKTKIWFSDAAIRAEYDEWEIRVICPLTNVNDFYGSYVDVNNKYQSTYSVDGMIQRVENVRGESPYTTVKALTLRWFDKVDNSRTIDTKWFMVCYGPLASQHSNQIATIRNFLESNSAYTVEEWSAHFPDIVSIDVYTVIPRWERRAIVVAGIEDTIFNPTMKHSDVMTILEAINPVVAADVNTLDVLETSALLYKSIGLIIVGNPENTDGAKSFYSRFPDYAIIGVNDSNINRLSAQTKQTIQLIERLVRQAEIDDGISSLPIDMSRTVFGNVNVIYGLVGNSQIQVVIKSSYNNAIT